MQRMPGQHVVRHPRRHRRPHPRRAAGDRDLRAGRLRGRAAGDPGPGRRGSVLPAPPPRGVISSLGWALMTPRLWATGTLGVLVVALIVYAAVVIPWHRPPAPRADQLDALRDLPRDQVQ